MAQEGGHSDREPEAWQTDAERPKLKRKDYEKKLRELQTELYWASPSSACKRATVVLTPLISDS